MADITAAIANTSGFVPQYWAMRALEVLRANIVLAGLVSSDKDYEPAWKGKVLNIGYPGKFTTVDKAADTPLTPQTPSGGKTITITLDHHKAVPFLVEDFASALANGTLFERYLEPAAIALAEQVETDLVNTAGQFQSRNGTPNTAVQYSTVVNAQKLLNDTKTPAGDRFMLLSTKDQAAMQTDPTLQHYFDYAHNETVQNGAVGRIAGFNAYWGQITPVVYKTYNVHATADSTFTYNSVTTASWDYDGTTAQAALQTLLEGITGVGAGNVIVGLGAVSGDFLVTFLTSSVTGTLTASTATITDPGFTPTFSMALHKNAIALAVRPFQDPPPGTGVMMSTVRDQDSGLSLRLSAQYDINNVGLRMNLDILYGFTVVRPELAVLIQS